MNIRDIEYILAVAEEKNFSRAAGKCNVSQSTLSIQIRKLEDSLGVSLFERDNKSVALTQAGSEILKSARIIISETNNIKEIADYYKNPMSGDLTIGAFPTLAPYLFPSIVAEVKENLQKVNLILIEDKTEILIEKLKNGEIDAALMALPVFEDSFKFSKIFEEEFLLAVNSKNKLSDNEFIEDAMLANEEIMLLDEGHCLRGQSLSVCKRAGANESKAYRGTSLEMLKNMVAANAGVTFVPQVAMDRYLKGVKYLRFKRPAPTREIALFWRETSPRSKLFSEVAKIIRSIKLF